MSDKDERSNPSVTALRDRPRANLTAGYVQRSGIRWDVLRIGLRSAAYGAFLGIVVLVLARVLLALLGVDPNSLLIFALGYFGICVGATLATVRVLYVRRETNL